MNDTTILASHFLLADLARPNTATYVLLVSVMVVLGIAYGFARILKRQPEGTIDPAAVRTFNRRLKVWLTMYAILGLALYFGQVVTVVMFGLVSFWALREFITMTPTRRADHRALFWTFFLFTPLQYIFVGIGDSFVGWEGTFAERSGLDKFDFFGLYTIMIPVYASLIIPARIAMSGDHKRFLERSAKIQFGLLVCVYALSHAPAILDLKLNTWDDSAGVSGELVPWNYTDARSTGFSDDVQTNNPDQSDADRTRKAKSGRTQRSEPGSTASLLIYFVLIVQLSEIAQFAWDRLLGRHVIAPSINATKSWEGFFGSVLTTSAVGILFWFTGVTPFTWYGSALMSMGIAIMGFLGSITMSAIKRDRGVADYGTLVQGHAGVLDRIDSMCFAAPVFFHLTRFFLGAQ